MTKKVVKKSSKKSRQNQARDKWFYKVRGSYLPRSYQGWLLYIPYSFALIDGVLWAHQPGALVFDQVIKIALVWAVAGETMTLIAKAKS